MMKTINRLLFGLVFTAVLTSAVPVRVNENAPVTAPVTVDALALHVCACGLAVSG